MGYLRSLQGAESENWQGQLWSEREAAMKMYSITHQAYTDHMNSCSQRCLTLLDGEAWNLHHPFWIYGPQFASEKIGQILSAQRIPTSSGSELPSAVTGTVDIQPATPE